MFLYQSAWLQTKGARSYQEDAALICKTAASDAASASPALLAVLADGMGGHTGGAIASRTICEGFVKTYAADSGAMPERLLTALAASNEAVAEQVTAQPSLYGMGATLVGASFGEQGLEWVSVGDSPLFLYRRGEISLLNADHSMAPALDRMAAEGKLSVEQARSDPRRHMLRSAVTGEEIELVDTSEQPLLLHAGDYVILASDGIHVLETSEIARVVAAYGNDGCEALAAALIRAIEQQRDPHQDNATVIVIRPIESADSN